MSQPPATPLAPLDSAAAQASAPRLQRVLGLGDLVLYGVVLIQPVGVIGMFGVASQMSHNAPSMNLWLVGIGALVGAFLLDYERAGTLLNFGAFLAFMGVNAAAVHVFWFHAPEGHRRHWLADIAVPTAGLAFCFWIWWSLPKPAQIIGGIWFAAGVIYAAIKTRGFRRRPVALDFNEA